MSSHVSTRVCSIKPGIKETKSFEATPKFFTVLKFWTLYNFGWWYFRTLFCLKLKLSELFLQVMLNRVTSVPLISIGFKTNQNWAYNRTPERCSFHQACTVRNKDSRNESRFFLLMILVEWAVMTFQNPKDIYFHWRCNLKIMI